MSRFAIAKPNDKDKAKVLVFFATKAAAESSDHSSQAQSQNKLRKKTKKRASAKGKDGAKAAEESDLGPALVLGAGGQTPEMASLLERLSEEKLFSGAAQQTFWVRDFASERRHSLLLVGLGESEKIDGEALRQAAASAQACLRTEKIDLACVDVDTVLPLLPNAAHLAQCLVEGFELASYSSDLYRRKKQGEAELTKISFYFSGHAPASFNQAIKEGVIIAEAVNFGRELGDRPGNLMTPTILADQTRKAASESSLKVSIWGRERIEREKMGSFLSVSLGSSQEPKFICMEYRGAGAGKTKPICYVGKGLTFDSGGISIKPAAGMEEMKYDMCGGANVIATLLAIARLKLRVNALGFVPATENMPGPGANKPGDIVTARNGRTIEVNNTDAEGRLILADALVYASEFEPAFIVDAATLTGAMVVALGNFHTGFFSRNEQLSAAIEKAATASGEPVWEMPSGEGHLKDMKGTYADLSNISSGKGAGSGTAAAFLGDFVPKEIPYAHFDIAGTAWHLGGRVPYAPKKGASGAMVRTFIELARLAERSEIFG